MWFDEVLVPLTAKFPVPYIIERSVTSDVHPPWFALLIKMMMALGTSEWILRLPSAMGGLLSIYLIYRLGGLLVSENCGLASAALLAVHPWHVILSRQVRPYALLMVAALLSLYFLAKIIRRFTLRDAVYFSLANIALYMLHFVAFLIIGTEILIFCLFYVLDRRRISLASAVNLVLLTLALSVPSLVFFFSRRGETGAPAPLLETLARVGGKLFDLAFDDFPTAFQMLGVFFAVSGLILLWRKQFHTALLLLLYFFVPTTLLIAVGYNSYFNPWHVLFLTLPLLVFMGYGLTRTTGGSQIAPVCVCLLLAVYLFQQKYDRYYLSESYSSYHAITRTLLDHTAPGDVVAYRGSVWHHIMQWYAGQDGRQLPPQQGLAKRADTPLVLAWTESDFGNVASSKESLRSVHGEPQVLFADPRISLYKYRVKNNSPLPIANIPGQIDLSFLPFEFYATADSFSGVMVEPDFSGRVFSAANNVQGYMEYKFANTSHEYPYHIVFIIEYDNDGCGNVLTVKHAFDDEPETVSFQSGGPDKAHVVPLQIIRGKPFHTLRLRVEMTTVAKTPEYFGGNLRTLNVKHIKAIFNCALPVQAAGMADR